MSGRDAGNQRFRVSGLLVRRLEEHGLRLAEVSRQAGLPAGFFAQEKIFVSTEELFALWRAIAMVAGDPALGLTLGVEACVHNQDPTAIAALCSQSFRDAVERMARYKQLTCPEEIQIHTGRAETSVAFTWLLANDDEPAVLIDLCLSWILAIGRRGTGQPLTPLRLELARKAAQRERLEAHYGCRVHFRADRNALVFRNADLERPFITRNADLLAMLGPQLDRELRERREGAALSERVSDAVKRTLAGRRPSLQDVARTLGMSARTLQRRLGESDVTFQQVVEDARREMAHHYLGQTSLELVETAYLLGYEDSNSFFRAFHQWEGRSPGEWRSAEQDAPALVDTRRRRTSY
jgi:AraC-like DNA-binding protein